ncbi:hypothetical protein JCM19238_3721 [Vibrio ponticus]|nr:hypothetical protein JCM19238_3721 [Vibrio ponticus]
MLAGKNIKHVGLFFLVLIASCKSLCVRYSKEGRVLAPVTCYAFALSGLVHSNNATAIKLEPMSTEMV